MLVMANHGIGAMVSDLGIEPFVQGGDHGARRSVIFQFRSTVNVSVVDGDLAGLCRTKLVQARHVGAVNVRRTFEVAFEKLLPDQLQMRSH
ncbi:MAG: hypothetical protein M3R60_00480 [Pseudomonadota bacterium]|nr:hypothetical protein [Pseudomonadota bacterium]